MLNLLLITCSCLLFADGQNAEAIKRVKSGEVTEARASWWGFDPEDSTLAIQSALSSGAKRVIIEDLGKPWIVTPLFAESDQEIFIEKGVIIQAKKDEFKGGNDSLLTISNKRNVTLSAYGALLKMHRDDYAREPYKKAEWRNCLQIRSSSNIKILGVTLAESGGDGIYLGVGTKGVTNKDIVIKDVICDRNYRQGISVITAENLLIENTIMRNTAGTAPMAGIDFEPNTAGERLVNCVMRNCVSENNKGVGYAFYLPNMTSESTPVSIRLENCIARGSNRHPLSFTNGEGKGKGPLTGKLEFVDCEFSGGTSPAVTLSSKPAKGTFVSFDKCRIEPGAGPDMPAILFRSRAGDTFDVGGADFKNCTVHDPLNRPVMRLHDWIGDLCLVDVSGTLKLQTGKTVTEIQITEEWLNQLHHGNTFKRFRKYETDSHRFVPLTESDGALLKQAPFSQRKEGTLIVYGVRETKIRLTLKHSRVGSYGGQSMRVTAYAPSGKELKIGEVPFENSATLTFDAPETGVYRIPLKCGPNRFQLLETNTATVMTTEARRVRFVSSIGDLFFYVPPKTKEFGVKVFGEGFEAVGAAILNPEGREVWSKTAITMPEQFVGTPLTTNGEIWVLRISKPTHGPMEDYYVELQGIPPFLATDRNCLLRPSK